MSEHTMTVRWRRDGAEYTDETYPRDHTWHFEGGVEVPASAAPGYSGSPDRVDPEEAFVAALSSCHMLTFLALAARKRLVVDTYDDRATGVLERDDEGRMAITSVVLRPKVTFSGDAPSDEELAKMHDKAHHHCFISNSVRTPVTIEPG